MKFLLMALLSALPVLSALAADAPTNAEILTNLTTDPRPAQFHRSALVLSERMTTLISGEMGTGEVKSALSRLNASGNDPDPESAITSLERARAIWALQACLLHPNDDVKILAVRALGKINDPESVPFITRILSLNYGLVSGSENATIHDIFLSSLGAALKTITGISVRDDGLAPDDHQADTEKLEKWCRDKGVGMGK